MRAPHTFRTRLVGLPGLALAGLLAGCASSHRAPAIADAPDHRVFAVYTPATLWVGDALGLRVLAERDPAIAFAIAQGPDSTGAFRTVQYRTQGHYATVPETED